ncbi:rhomboid family intramembrane serine protease [Chitinimonas naiadis]
MSRDLQSDFLHRLGQLSPRAPITPILVGLNLLVFIGMLLAGAGLVEINPAVAVRWGSNYGSLTTGGEWWRLLSSTFIHFGILHLAFNMLALYQTGPMVERMYGSLHFLVLYVIAGLVGSAASLLWNPQVHSAGASGAIFGVFGGMLAFMIKPGSAVPPAIVNAHRNSTLVFIAFNLFYGFASTGIDNAAHIGGLLSGFLVGLLLARPLSPQARGRTFDLRIVLALLAATLLLGGMAYQITPNAAAARLGRLSP